MPSNANDDLETTATVWPRWWAPAVGLLLFSCSPSSLKDVEVSGHVFRWSNYGAVVDFDGDGEDEYVGIVPGLKATEVFFRDVNGIDYIRQEARSPYTEAHCGPYMIAGGTFGSSSVGAVVVADFCGWWWFDRRLQGRPLQLPAEASESRYVGLVRLRGSEEHLVVSSLDEAWLLESPQSPSVLVHQNFFVSRGQRYTPGDSPVLRYGDDAVIFQAVETDTNGAVLHRIDVRDRSVVGGYVKLAQRRNPRFIQPFTAFERLVSVRGCPGMLLGTGTFADTPGRTPTFLQRLVLHEEDFSPADVAPLTGSPFGLAVVGAEEEYAEIWLFLNDALEMYRAPKPSCIDWRLIARTPIRSSSFPERGSLVASVLRSGTNHEVVVYDGFSLWTFRFADSPARIEQTVHPVHRERTDSLGE
jgi:hypothetical protein